MDAPTSSSHDIFVSYSRQDADWAGAFVDTLKKRGWSVFLDTRSIGPGDEWSLEIDSAIDDAKVVIALWSARSVRSSYVIAEVARAVVHGTLIPLSIDRTQAPPAFRRFQTQPMILEGARSLPSPLVAAIESRLAATEPPAPPSAEEQRLREELARMTALARDRGVPLLALQTLLERLGEVDVAPEAVPARLDSFVSEFLKLKADLARPSNADPDVATIQKRALDRLEAADLDGARAVIAGALTRQREIHQEAARKTATLLADLARIDVMQVRYRDAISTYGEAADLVGFDTDAALDHRLSQVDALIKQGDEFGDNAALLRAIEVIQGRALPLVSRERDPLAWARLQGVLGTALLTLGAREDTTDRLQQAVKAYQGALEEFTRVRDPESWATTQNNLGNALATLGERQSGTTRLEEAVAAYRAALEERTRDRVPMAWAATQNNLGDVLRRLGDRENGTAHLEEAIDACRAALQERKRERVPLDWAMSQNNLANALATLGRWESGTARLDEAVTAYRTALEEYTRDRVPLDWAMTQNNLGHVLRMLGERENRVDRLEQAIAASRAALEEHTRERSPLDWAMTQYTLGISLHALGEREGGIARLEEAAAACRAALEECTNDDMPPQWAADIQATLDRTLALIEERSAR